MNYKETTLAGVSWVRCKLITITNPLAGTSPLDGQSYVPMADFYEEKVISIDGVQTKVDSGSCQKVFDAASAIQILNPLTGEATGGTITHAELYTILFSLYLQTATERDQISNP